MTLAPGKPGSALAAWRLLGMRQWLLAAVVGLVLALGQTLQAAAPLWPRMQHAKVGLLVIIGARWLPLMVALACVLLFVSVWLHERRERPSLVEHLRWVVGAAVLATLLLDWPSWALCRAVFEFLGLRIRPFWAGMDTPQLLGVLWSRSLPVAAIAAVIWVCIDRYRRGALRSGQALAAAQLRLAGVQRRALEGQLRILQSRVEPAFLFDTLSLVHERFETASAQQLLESLIRYLRAALPASDRTGGTVGQQFDLVRAYLDIECSRATGGLRASVEVPAALRHAPMAPALLLPLVADAATNAGAAATVGVRAGASPGFVVVNIDVERTRSDAAPRGAAVATVGRHLSALYGAGAALELTGLPAGGRRIRLTIPVPMP